MTVKPEEIGPLVRALKNREPGLLEFFEEASRATTTATRPDLREQGDLRRANAAAALVLLDRPDAAFRLLRFGPTLRCGRS